MLYRYKPPNQGLWNGVGGHLEPGETPKDSVLREVYEETGFCLSAVRFAGLLTWEGFEIPNGGLYLFTAQVGPGEEPVFVMRASWPGNRATGCFQPVRWCRTSTVLGLRCWAGRYPASIILFMTGGRLYNTCRELSWLASMWDNARWR